MREVTAVEERESADVSREMQTEDRTKAAKSAGLCERVGISSSIENEFGEVSARSELAVFRALEGSSTGGFCQGIGVVWSNTVDSGVVDGYPGSREDVAVSVQILLILGGDVAINVRRVEYDSAGVSL